MVIIQLHRKRRKIIGYNTKAGIVDAGRWICRYLLQLASTVTAKLHSQSTILVIMLSCFLIFQNQVDMFVAFPCVRHREWRYDVAKETTPTVTKLIQYCQYKRNILLPVAVSFAHLPILRPSKKEESAFLDWKLLELVFIYNHLIQL
jgi:hypothetical protein